MKPFRPLFVRYEIESLRQKLYTTSLAASNNINITDS